MNNNPKNLIIGKTYLVRHMPSNGDWKLAKITRITEQGFPYAVFSKHGFGDDKGNGIISADTYQIQELPAKKEWVPPVTDEELDLIELITYVNSRIKGSSPGVSETIAKSTRAVVKTGTGNSFVTAIREYKKYKS